MPAGGTLRGFTDGGGMLPREGGGTLARGGGTLPPVTGGGGWLLPDKGDGVTGGGPEGGGIVGRKARRAIPKGYGEARAKGQPLCRRLVGSD